MVLPRAKGRSKSPTLHSYGDGALLPYRTLCVPTPLLGRNTTMSPGHKSSAETYFMSVRPPRSTARLGPLCYGLSNRAEIAT